MSVQNPLRQNKYKYKIVEARKEPAVQAGYIGNNEYKKCAQIAYPINELFIRRSIPD